MTNTDWSQDGVPENGTTLTNKDIFVGVCFYPRKTFRYIINQKCDKHVILLVILCGIGSSFQTSNIFEVHDIASFFDKISMPLIKSAFIGFAFFFLYAFGLYGSGKMLGGRADRKSIFRIISYASLPLAFILTITVCIHTGFMLSFIQDLDQVNAEVMALLEATGNILGFVILIAIVWALVLSIIGISELQQLSIGKAILSFVIASLIMALPILVIVGGLTYR